MYIPPGLCFTSCVLGYCGNQKPTFEIHLNIKLVFQGDCLRWKIGGVFPQLVFYSVRWSRTTLACARKRLWFMASDAWIVSDHLLHVLECLQLQQISLGFGTGLN